MLGSPQQSQAGIDHAPEATDAVGIFVVQHIMIDLGQLAFPHDLADHAMAFIKLCVGYHLAIVPARAIDAKSVQSVTNQWAGSCGTLVGETLP